MRWLCAILLGICCGFGCRNAASGAETPPPRIVSLAPSVTEMVFAIGAGDTLVGVTDHCEYPPEATRLPKVGMYQSPNPEIILSLRPDIVLALREHTPIFPLLDTLKLRYETMDHRSLPGLLESITHLGELCGKQGEAEALRAAVEEGLRPMSAVDAAAAPTLLMTLGRDYGTGGIANAYCIGRDDLYDHVIRAAGFRNAYTGKLAYPVLSGEGVAALRPDYIVELVLPDDGAGGMGTRVTDTALLRDWRELTGLPAVKEGRVHFIRAGYAVVPGARLLLLKRDLALFLPHTAGVAGTP